MPRITSPSTSRISNPACCHRNINGWSKWQDITLRKPWRCAAPPGLTAVTRISFWLVSTPPSTDRPKVTMVTWQYITLCICLPIVGQFFSISITTTSQSAVSGYLLMRACCWLVCSSSHAMNDSSLLAESLWALLRREKVDDIGCGGNSKLTWQPCWAYLGLLMIQMVPILLLHFLVCFQLMLYAGCSLHRVLYNSSMWCRRVIVIEGEIMLIIWGGIICQIVCGTYEAFLINKVVDKVECQNSDPCFAL